MKEIRKNPDAYMGKQAITKHGDVVQIVRWDIECGGNTMMVGVVYLTPLYLSDCFPIPRRSRFYDEDIDTLTPQNSRI